MPSINELFCKSKGKAILFKGKTLKMADNIPFENGERVNLSIEQTNSKLKQGVCLYLFGSIEVENTGEKIDERVVFWEDTAPKKITIKLWLADSERKRKLVLPKNGILGIKNVWDIGNGKMASWIGNSAMISEEIDSGKRYYCNDGEYEDNFDNIIFTVTRKEK